MTEAITEPQEPGVESDGWPISELMRRFQNNEITAEEYCDLQDAALKEESKNYLPVEKARRKSLGQKVLGLFKSINT
jgi:hypothetical protein